MKKNIWEDQVLWKKLFFILLAVAFFVGIYSMPQQEEETYKFENGLEVSKETLSQLSEVVGEGSFQLCNIPSNKCIILKKLKDGN